MNFDSFYTFAVVWIVVAILTFILLQFVVAPFGRHSRKDWGFMVSNKMAWVIMESVSLFTFSYFFLTGNIEKHAIHWFIFSLWFIHYVNRSFIYPLRQKGKNKKMPAVIMFSAIFFNSINGFLNGYFLGNYSDFLYNSYFTSIIFIAGTLLFIIGFYINLRSDNILLALRKEDDNSYSIPQGFMFKYISCPNHYGEIIEWIGFAVLSGNIAATSFAIWTFANLAPRSIAHHKWYLKTFPDYPKKRKALIPYIW